jgi:hypothetical protein
MTPATPTIPTDPNLAQEQLNAQNELVGSLQTQTQGDMASLMARYGTQLAMSGTNIPPLVSSTTGGLGQPTAGRSG